MIDDWIDDWWSLFSTFQLSQNSLTFFILPKAVDEIYGDEIEKYYWRIQTMFERKHIIVIT